MKGYYFITDSNLSRAGNRSDVLAAVSCGVNVVQYRNKNAETREMYREAMDLSQICRDAGSLFLVNDRLDVAMAVEADGVHVGQADMPCPKARKLLGRDKIIGVTVHNLAEALQAEKEGADYLGVSPIFETATKKDAGRPAGIRLIEEIREPGEPAAHSHRRHKSLQCPPGGPGRGGWPVRHILRGGAGGRGRADTPVSGAV